MSRIGRMPVVIPKGVEVTLEGPAVTVKGPKGQMSHTVHPEIQVTQQDGQLLVTRSSDQREHRALHGLTRSLLYNMVEGVTKGYQRTLEIVGVGYRAQLAGKRLVLQVGMSKPAEVEPPEGIAFVVEGTNRVHVQGVDKQQVGQTAANLRAMRPPDAYKGKGIRYAGERIKLKPGKTAAKKK